MPRRSTRWRSSTPASSQRISCRAPTRYLNGASPGAGLPELQFAHFGSAVLGFGDLFVAAVLGARLAGERQLQLRATAVAACLALAFDLLFFLVSELPATVPIALTLAVLQLSARQRTVSDSASQPVVASGLRGAAA